MAKSVYQYADGSVSEPSAPNKYTISMGAILVIAFIAVIFIYVKHK